MANGVPAPTITDGMPANRSDWHPEVLSAMRRFVAGDVVQSPPLFYFADPRYAVWGGTRPYVSGSVGPEIIDAAPIAPPFGLITTQTCDLSEDGFDPPTKAWFQVAPVYDMASLDGGTRKLLRDGKGPIHLLHVPALPRENNQLWIADLRLEVPIEKSWLVGRRPIPGFHDEVSQREVSSRVAALRARPAWADVIVTNVQRVVIEWVRLLKIAEPELFAELVQKVGEIGARTDSMLSPSTFQLAAFCNEELSESLSQWWSRLNHAIRETLLSADVSCQQELLLNYESCSIALYRQFAPVPLLRYSPM